MVRRRNCSLDSCLKRIVLRRTSESNIGNFDSAHMKPFCILSNKVTKSRVLGHYQNLLSDQSHHSETPKFTECMMEPNRRGCSRCSITSMQFRHICCVKTHYMQKDSTNLSLRTSHMQFDSCWPNLKNWLDERSNFWLWHQKFDHQTQQSCNNQQGSRHPIILAVSLNTLDMEDSAPNELSVWLWLKSDILWQDVRTPCDTA